MYKKILVAIDGSEPSNHALDHAVEIATKFKAKLIMLAVIQRVIIPIFPDEGFGGIPLSAAKDMAQYQDKMRLACARAVFFDGCSDAGGFGIVSVVVGYAFGVDVLVEGFGIVDHGLLFEEAAAAARARSGKRYRIGASNDLVAQAYAPIILSLSAMTRARARTVKFLHVSLLGQ